MMFFQKSFPCLLPFSIKIPHSEQWVQLMTMAFAFQLLHLLNNCYKRGVKIVSVSWVTCFTTIMTYNWQAQLQL